MCSSLLCCFLLCVSLLRQPASKAYMQPWKVLSSHFHLPSASASPLDGFNSVALVSCIQDSNKGTALERWIDCLELHTIKSVESDTSHGSSVTDEYEAMEVVLPELPKAFPAIAPANELSVCGEALRKEDINNGIMLPPSNDLEGSESGIGHKLHRNGHLERCTDCVELTSVLDNKSIEVNARYEMSIGQYKAKLIGEPAFSLEESQKTSLDEGKTLIHKVIESGISAGYSEEEFQVAEGTARVAQSSNEVLDPGVESKGNDGSILFLKLNVSALILCAIFLSRKLHITRKRAIGASHNSKGESINKKSHHQHLHNEANTQFDNWMSEALGPPLGTAIGAVFAEVLIHRDCPVNQHISADELDMCLKAATTESLMPVFGIECLKLVDKFSTAFQSTYRTIEVLSKARHKGSQKILDQTIRKTSGGLLGCPILRHSCMRDTHTCGTTDYPEFKVHQQKREKVKEWHPGISEKDLAGKSAQDATATVQSCFCTPNVNQNSRSENGLHLSSCKLSSAYVSCESVQEQELYPQHFRTAQTCRCTSNDCRLVKYNTQNSKRHDDPLILEQDMESSLTGSCLIATDGCCGTENSLKDDALVSGRTSLFCINGPNRRTCISNEVDRTSSLGNYECCSNKPEQQLKSEMGCRMTFDCVDRKENVPTAIKNLNDMQHAITCTETSHFSSSERSWQETFLQTFEKLVQTQEHHNYIRSIELSQRIKHLTLNEEQILLAHEANKLTKEKLFFSHDKADFKRNEAHEKKIVAAHLELSRTCADELAAGLSIMLLSLAYSVRRYSFVLLSNLISSCQPSVKESRRSSWIHIDRLYNSLDVFTSIFQAFICQVTVTGRLLVGFILTALVTSAILRRSAVGSSQVMPATIIVIVLGGLCGFAGKISVDSLGGNGLYWLVMWEAFCSLHAFVACFTPVVFRLLNGSPFRKRHFIFLPPWFRRLAFHTTIVGILPLLAGQLPFIPFRVLAENLFTSLINDMITPVMLYSRELVG